MKLKIAVIFGGTSEKRDVSISSTAQVIEAPRSIGQEVLAVKTSRGLLSQDKKLQLPAAKVSDLSSASGALAMLRTNDASGNSFPELCEKTCLSAISRRIHHETQVWWGLSARGSNSDGCKSARSSQLPIDFLSAAETTFLNYFVFLEKYRLYIHISLLCIIFYLNDNSIFFF